MENDSKSSWYDVLYRASQYGKWEGHRVQIPINLDPKTDRLDYVKEHLQKEGIEFARDQVKFGKLRKSKTEEA